MVSFSKSRYHSIMHSSLNSSALAEPRQPKTSGAHYFRFPALFTVKVINTAEYQLQQLQHGTTKQRSLTLAEVMVVVNVTFLRHRVSRGEWLASVSVLPCNRFFQLNTYVSWPVSGCSEWWRRLDSWWRRDDACFCTAPLSWQSHPATGNNMAAAAATSDEWIRGRQ